VLEGPLWIDIFPRRTAAEIGQAGPTRRPPPVPGLDPYAYHFDLREKPLAAGVSLSERLAYLKAITADRLQTNPVNVIQLALGALQLRDADQLPLVAAVVEWLERSADREGLLAYRFPMPHTFSLDPPWYSSLAQGEAGSLLVRAAALLDRPELCGLAARMVEPLLRVDSPLVAITPEGLVLEEYPTDPPAHVLNGWITSLFGLYDVAQAPDAATADKAGEAFRAGSETLAARLHLYRLAFGWSRYDLYPHPLINVSSVSYQRLHVAQLRALHSLIDVSLFASTADEWERALASRRGRLVGVGRKVAFRLVRPRWRRV
jgi:D-glucuronyl C5-epimerase C-terminus